MKYKALFALLIAIPALTFGQARHGLENAFLKNDLDAANHAFDNVDWTNCGGLQAYITSIASGLSGAVDWDDVTNKPSTFPPSVHAHAYSLLTGLPTLGTASVLDVAATGNATTAQIVKGNDTRLTDARTPTAHASTHATAGSDPITPGSIGAQVAGSYVNANGAITAATKTKITYDAKGLVTAGADATTADIADSTDKRYVTDAEQTVIGNTSGTNTGDQDLSSYQTKAGVLALSGFSSITGTLPAANIADLSSTYQPKDADLTTWAGITPGTGVGTFLTTPSSANLLAALTDETGTGAAVFGTGPTLVAPINITGAVGSSALTVTGATQTASFPILDATQTWNASGTVFSGIKLNITKTASADTSRLLDLQQGGTSVFAVNQRSDNFANPALQLGGDTTTGWYRSGANQWTWTVAGAPNLSMYSALIRLAPATVLGWSGSSNSTGSHDVGLARSAAGVVEINNGSAGGAGNLTVNGGTITGGATGLSLAAGGTNQNITLTPSGTGIITVGAAIRGLAGTPALPTYAFTALTNSGMTAGVTGPVLVSQGTSIVSAFNGAKDGIALRSADGQIIWSTDITASQPAGDIGLARNAAGVMEVNSGTIGTLRDITLRNATASGTLAVTGASTLTGGVIGGVQALSGAGAVNLTTVSTAVTTTAAANALTLANGTNGQIKTVVHVVKGTLGTAILTPTTANGFTSVTFTNAGDSVMLQYFSSGGWVVIGSHGVTIT